MKQIMEKNLLYFEKSIQLPMNWHGASIYKSVFKDVKTGEQILLNSCIFSQDISKTFGEHYYSTITDAESDYDILWKITNGEVESIDEEFIHVQGVYEKLLADGVSNLEMKDVILDYLKSEQKVNCR